MSFFFLQYHAQSIVKTMNTDVKCMQSGVLH